MKDNPEKKALQSNENVALSDSELELSINDKLRLETATIAWRDLQRFFAAGKVIAVLPGTSLVEVAAQLHNDNKHSFQQWIDKKVVAAVSDDQARRWFENDSTLWAVVVSPWVLVQEPASLDKAGSNGEQLH